jgi:HK97 family phage portal protein
MSLISEVLGARRGEQKILDASDLTFERLLGLTQPSKAGVRVNVDTALRQAVVFACCRVIAEDVAKLPFRLHQVTGTKRVVANKHPLHKLLYRKPNDWMTPFEFIETLTLHAVLAQGGFAWISRSWDGRILELIPLLPGAVIRRPFALTHEVVFDVSDQKGIIGTFTRDQILHIRGPSWDTATGLSLVQEARESIGLGIAIEEHQARLHSNGARPSGILSTDKTLTKEARERLKALFADGFASVQNAGKVPVLDDGLKFISSAMTSVDAETLNSRKFQIEEICRTFRVYPQKVMHTDKASTYASAEQFNIHHALDTVQPWVIRWEQAVARDCLTDEELDAGYEPTLDMRALLRGDSTARGNYYKNGILDGWLTRQEARIDEERDPIPGLDVPLMPLNMTDGTKPPAPPAAPAPPGAPGTTGKPTTQPAVGDGAKVPDLVPAAA